MYKKEKSNVLMLSTGLDSINAANLSPGKVEFSLKKLQLMRCGRIMSA